MIPLVCVCLSNVVVAVEAIQSQSGSSRDSPLLPCLSNLPLTLTPLHLKLQGCVMAVRSKYIEPLAKYSQMRYSSCCHWRFRLECGWERIGPGSCLVPGTVPV